MECLANNINKKVYQLKICAFDFEKKNMNNYNNSNSTRHITYQTVKQFCILKLGESKFFCKHNKWENEVNKEKSKKNEHFK